MTNEQLLFLTSLGLGLSLGYAMKLRRKLKRGQETFGRLQESINYLLTRMEEQGVDLEEFDILALTTILSED